MEMQMPGAPQSLSDSLGRWHRDYWRDKRRFVPIPIRERVARGRELNLQRQMAEPLKARWEASNTLSPLPGPYSEYSSNPIIAARAAAMAAIDFLLSARLSMRQEWFPLACYDSS